MRDIVDTDLNGLFAPAGGLGGFDRLAPEGALGRMLCGRLLTVDAASRGHSSRLRSERAALPQQVAAVGTQS